MLKAPRIRAWRDQLKTRIDGFRPRIDQLQSGVAQLNARLADWKLTHPAAYRRAVQAVVLVCSMVAGSALWYVGSALYHLPSKDAVARIGDMNQATAVFDREDQIAFTIYKEQRIDVPLSRVSPTLIKAVIATEDQRFYDHHGFDVLRIASAAFENLRSGRAAQGGSTITQQLARQSFLTPEKTLRRKLQEFVLARRIERAYTKDQILEIYLNKIYFGDGLYGVEAASRGYFGKHASEVNVEEAALLAGLIQSPSRYSPTVNLVRARNRRNVVLQAMVSNKAITRSEWEQARAAKVALTDGFHSEAPFAEYFKEQVRLELVQRFGWERVYQGGLRVFSTIDSAMQRAAEASIAEGLTSLDKRLAAKGAKPSPKAAKGSADPLQAALIALQPGTGEVLAMVGGRDFGKSPFNRAVQARRQPGSAFKPLVFSAALEQGYSPASMITRLNDPIDTLQGAWTPEEGHAGADALSLRAALRVSSNRAAVRLLEDIGIGQALSAAKSMGVGDVPGVPSLALGSGEVTLQALTAAYGAFANRGVVAQPRLIRRVEDRNGVVLYTSEPLTNRATSETTAYLMANMMADVVNAGTAARVRSLGFTLPAAGKTGTTNDFHDAWFIGFTPKVVAGVWVGFDQPRTIMRNGFAADIAVPVWAAFMKDATKKDKAEWIRAPRGIVSARVCRLSGKLANDRCDDVDLVDEEGHETSHSMVYTEYFANGTQPLEKCDLHRPRTLVGAVASLFHEQPQVRRMTLEEAGVPVVPPAAAPAVTATAPAPKEVPPAPEKKRGFWSKLFGRR